MKVSRIIAVVGAVLIFLFAVGGDQRIEAQTTISTQTPLVPPQPLSVGTTPIPSALPQVAAVQVTAPTEPTTSVSLGTWIGDLLGVLASIFITAIGSFAVQWFRYFAKKAGVDLSQATSDRLDQIITNGLHYGASEAQHELAGKMNVEVKNRIIADAVSYAQANGPKLIASMANPATVQELQARAAKVLSTIGPDAINAPAPVISQGMTRSGEIITSVSQPTQPAA